MLHKPFTDTEQQLALLRLRGMKVSKSTHFRLEREGYYAVINGYKTLFIDKDASIQASDDRYFYPAQLSMMCIGFFVLIESFDS